MEKINFINFSALHNWSASHLLGEDFQYNKKFPLVKIGSFLKKNNKTVSIENGKTYSRVTVSGANRGVKLRDRETGENIGTKRQYVVKAGQFILSKIDARNGAMGLIPPELDGAIVTNDFPTFDVDYNLILPQFLLLITTTERFIEFAQSCSSGTTNRQRIDLAKFLDVQIPLPPLNDARAKQMNVSNLLTQKKLIEAYLKKIKDSESATRLVVEKKAEIEDFLYAELGIPKNKSISSKPGLKFTSFKALNDRWDIYKPSILNISKYPLVSFKDVIIKISTGTTPPSARKDYFDGDVNFYTPSDIGESIYLTEASRKLTVKALEDKKARVFKKNTLLFVGIGTIGKVGIVKNEVSTSNQQITGIVIDEQKANLEFILFYINVFNAEITKAQTKTTIPILNQKGIEQIKIPLPPLKIQEKISTSILKIVNEIRTENLNSKRLYREAIIDFEDVIFKVD